MNQIDRMNGAANDPGADQLLRFAMRCTLPLAVVGTVGLVLFIRWGFGL